MTVLMWTVVEQIIASMRHTQQTHTANSADELNVSVSNDV